MHPGSDKPDRDSVRIVFMGTPAFAEVVLQGLLSEKWNVVGVVTKPDRPRGRGRRVSPSPVKEIALSGGLPVLQPETMKDMGFLDSLQGLAPDLIVTAAYGKILPESVLALPRLGCYNVHASILPAYRGAAPIPWALLKGEKETGITIFRMDAGMDTGEVLACERLEIEPDETTGRLTRRLALLAVRMLPEALERVIQGKADLVAQDHSRATYAPFLKKADGLIDWGRSAAELVNRIRAFDPWPGAFTHLQGKKLSIWEADALPDSPAIPQGGGQTRGPVGARVGSPTGAPASSQSDRKASNETDRPVGSPGEILSLSPEGIQVKTGQGVLRIRSLQIEGKKRVPAVDFLHGHHLQAGDKLG